MIKLSTYDDYPVGSVRSGYSNGFTLWRDDETEIPLAEGCIQFEPDSSVMICGEAVIY